MSDFKGFEHMREYRFREWLRFTRSRPYVCQPLMKNFWQCFDHFHFDKNIEEEEARASCLEKFNYEECFNENKEKLSENRKYNFTVVLPSSGAAEEEEEE